MNNSPLKIQLERDGRLLRLTLARPFKNIIDAAMIAAIQETLDKHKEDNELAAVLIEAEGPNFSFGASVEEHLPAQCSQMLRQLHRLIITLIEFPLPVLVAVRGFCLGGGLELACAGSMIFASNDAAFGQPEIQIGVFAPAASCLLPERISRPQAEDLLFSGRSMDSEEALRIGLINRISDSPESTALEYFDKQLAPRSSCSLRHAVRAARGDFIERMRKKITEVEKIYLQQLMSSHDAVEGLNAFMEKRPPKWEHR